MAKVTHVERRDVEYTLVLSAEEAQDLLGVINSDSDANIADIRYLNSEVYNVIDALKEALS